jgi:diguanylate cyclase (GGDEF)-like protein
VKKLKKEILRASQDKQPLCIARCEIDFIDQISGVYGQVVREYLLRRVRQHISSEIRSFDMPTQARSDKPDNDEIVLVFNCSEENAKRIFERVRLSVENSSFYYGSLVIKLTISCGLTIFNPPADLRDGPILINSVGRALYLAKENGHNRVFVEG